MPKIYALYDRRARNTLTPLIVSPNDVTPVREVQRLVNEPKSIIHEHADDFDLMLLGTINLENGELEAQTPEIVATAASLKNAAH